MLKSVGMFQFWRHDGVNGPSHQAIPLKPEQDLDESFFEVPSISPCKWLNRLVSLSSQIITNTAHLSAMRFNINRGEHAALNAQTYSTNAVFL